MLFNRALWAPGLARVLDTSLRYTVDKTSREVLFLPLPAELKYRAKPFIDVTMDRLAKGLGALLILVLIKVGARPHLAATELRQPDDGRAVGRHRDAARKGYLRSFRRSIEQQDVEAAEIRLDTADLSHDRDAGQRAVASRAAARALRDRPARVDGQAAPGHAAAAAPRVAGGPRAGAARRRKRPGPSGGRALAAAASSAR